MRKTWEKAESAFQKEAFTRALNKAGFSPSQVNFLFAGDLLNQNIASTFGLRETNVPLLGQFGACSTMAQTLALAAIFVDSGAADVCSAVTSSHFCTAERQFRYPLEYGGQRPPTSQWTATAAGSAVVGMGGNGPHIESVCIGRVTDLGVTDMNNMGRRHGPAAADTLYNYFQDTATKPDDYDLILTGDLSSVGSDLLRKLLEKKGYKLGDEYNDCGLLMYDRDKQDVHAGDPAAAVPPPCCAPTSSARWSGASFPASSSWGPARSCPPPPPSRGKVSPASPIWCIWSNSPRK